MSSVPKDRGLILGISKIPFPLARVLVNFPFIFKFIMVKTRKVFYEQKFNL